MADILLDVQSPPATPAAGQAVIFVDNVSKKLCTKDDAGLVDTLDDTINYSVANQTGFAADAYLLGSNVKMPQGLAKIGTIYRLKFDMVKTAAGVAAATLVLRFGTAGAIGDAALITFTFGAGTAAIDTGIFEVRAHFRAVGAATAVLVAMVQLNHHLAATGLTATGASGTGILLGVSGTFNSTVANSFLGASFNGGAAFSGTNTIVQAEAVNV